MEEGFKVPIFPAKPPPIKEITTDTSKKPETPEIPYKIPKWNGPTPEQQYSFEVLKNGQIVDNVEDLQSKPFWLIGRLPVGTGVDISAAHPTISRFHAVLQYKESTEDDEGEKVESGWFIFDLDSTHGTFLNKTRVKPRTFVRVRVGHQLKFGNSTRNYILTGPSEDEEEASAETITELLEQKRQKIAEMQQKLLEEKLEKERKLKEEEEAGVSWGMSEDAEDEEPSAINPFSVTNNEELFLDDPKKTLRGFFEREGLDLQYRCDELSPGVFICRVDLPVDDECGKSVTCEVQHKGKKKECVVQCALEACRILDRHGILRQANQESKRVKRPANSDDSDDDNFFDRTGDVEKKRQKKLGPTQANPMTYDQLMEQEKEILEKIQVSEKKLESMVEMEKRKNAQNDDDLDDFMENLSNLDHKVDKFAISSIKTEIAQMKVELQKIQKLANIAKPSIKLPPMKGKLPLFGKRTSLGRNFGVKSVQEVKKVEVEGDFEVEEDEKDVEMEVKIQGKFEKIEGKVGEVKIKSEETKEKSGKIEESSSKNEEKPSEAQEKRVKSDEMEVETTKPDQEVSKPPQKTEENTSEPEKSRKSPSKPPPPPEEPSQDSLALKKRKNRTRIRGNRLRENIDMNDDDEYIDEEKVSTWVAPEDQSGDGTTHLNEKYGY